MRVLKTVRLRLRSVFRRNHVENELAAELREHLEREIERHRAAGLSHAEARAAALREFGNVALIQEQCRDVRGVLWLEDLLRDVVYALRMMRRAPGHTAVTALSLAAALGANTATFSVVNTLLLRRLPVANPGDLVELGSETPNGPGNFPYSLYEACSRREQHLHRGGGGVVAGGSRGQRDAGSAATRPVCLRKLLPGTGHQAGHRSPSRI
jgi:hypothetical protein